MIDIDPRLGNILVGWRLPELVSVGEELIPEGWCVRSGVLCIIDDNATPRISDALLTLKSAISKNDAWRLALDLGVDEICGPCPQLIVVL